MSKKPQNHRPHTAFARHLTKRGITTTWLAARVGVTSKTVMAWRQGVRSPGPAAIRMLAIELGISIDAVAKMFPESRAARFRKFQQEKS